MAPYTPFANVSTSSLNKETNPHLLATRTTGACVQLVILPDDDRSGNTRSVMDTSERDKCLARKEKAEALYDAATSPEVGSTLLGQIQTLERTLAQFIPEAADPEEELDEWKKVSSELRSHSNSRRALTESHFSQSCLPKVMRTQHDRLRLEEEDYLLIRQPAFSNYEGAVLPSQQQFFSLTGPQGFGKSTFLHYFATKYCCHAAYLVVYLPACPTETHHLQYDVAQAFYRGCRIAELTQYKELQFSDTLYDMLQKCIDFAASKQKILLLVIDQMKTEEREFFDSTIRTLCDLSGHRIKVILSSSVSNNSFGMNRIQSLERYSHKITANEAALLESRCTNKNITAKTLTELPFQVAAEKLTGRKVSLLELAKDLAEKMLKNPGDDAYYYLQMAADVTKKDHKRDCDFGATLDGEHFYVDSADDGRFFIAEYREGFASEVLAIMRSRQGDYEYYLPLTIGIS